ncbi:hypothetical protein EIP86_004081 [Pleurotus ostreatoroseus]|nr:hypothetical protein EIP86_004081 [Pleurotus ostreatoroseus]
MSYYDQYNSRQAQGTYPPQQYADQETSYNPYESTQPHQTYEQEGYGYSDANFNNYRDEPAEAVGAAPAKAEKNVFESEAYTPSTRALEPKTSRGMKRWRHENQGHLWTKGSPIRVFCRFFGCLVFTFIFLFISIVLSLLLWIEPPNVEIGEVAPFAQNGSTVQLQQNPLGVTVNLGVPISVNNPNYFSVKFKSIKADIFYPINDTQVGSGALYNLEIADHKQTNFTLPFSLNYTETIDPNFKILDDIANHCGFTGSSASNINVNYEIHLSFQVLFVTISPTIKNSASFSCPVSESDIADLLKAAGIDLSGLATLAKLLR